MLSLNTSYINFADTKQVNQKLINSLLMIGVDVVGACAINLLLEVLQGHNLTQVKLMLFSKPFLFEQLLRCRSLIVANLRKYDLVLLLQKDFQPKDPRNYKVLNYILNYIIEFRGAWELYLADLNKQALKDGGGFIDYSYNHGYNEKYYIPVLQNSSNWYFIFDGDKLRNDFEKMKFKRALSLKKAILALR